MSFDRVIYCRMTPCIHVFTLRCLKLHNVGQWGSSRRSGENVEEQHLLLQGIQVSCNQGDPKPAKQAAEAAPKQEAPDQKDQAHVPKACVRHAGLSQNDELVVSDDLTIKAYGILLSVPRHSGVYSHGAMKGFAMWCFWGLEDVPTCWLCALRRYH